MKTELVKIWRYNTATGYWALMRDCYKENAGKWLDILQGDEPDATFKATNRRPTKAPERKQ